MNAYNQSPLITRSARVKPMPSAANYAARTVRPPVRPKSSNGVPKNRRRFDKLFVIFVCLVLVFVALTHRSSAAPIPEVQSALAGRCLDDSKDLRTANAEVLASACNGSAEEAWSFENASITHGAGFCLGVVGNSQNSGAKVALSVCNGNTPGQVWLREGNNFMNPNGGFCLSAPQNVTAQLAVASCDLSSASQSWTLSQSKSNIHESVVPAPCAAKTEGQKVACAAEAQWNLWQTESSNHPALLNEYSDGNGYEEWCADFVSYAYKAAGYPLTNGERDGWDEYNANDVQYDGFTMHAAGTYTPKPGDVAFFDYPGGHVEIVVSGGQTPTFVYGDSAITDPTTGNGGMDANTTQANDDGIPGQVTYYLSPN